jgi:hypothetical protein
MNIRDVLENDILHQVEKPSRYLGTELNSVHKDLKDDHAFAYYFASKCHEKLGNYEKAVEYDKKFTDIMEVSEFWRDWAAEFNFKPEKLVFDEKETNGDTLLTASDPRLPSVPKDTDPKMLGNSAGWGTM